MPTLIVSPRQTEDSDALYDAAPHLGWQAKRLDSWHAPESLHGRDDLALYGEALFVRYLADQLGYALLEAQPTWLASLPKTYTRREIRYMHLGDAAQITTPMFIKPAGDKAFTAKVYATGAELLAAEPDLSREISILASEVVRWVLEYRCFVLNREVQTLSLYNREGNLTKSEDGRWFQLPEANVQARAFALRVLADASIAVPPAFVMDIGIIDGRGWAVLEANPVWASGIYGCDPLRVLPAVNRSCIQQALLTDEDRQWLPTWESWEPE